jgi:hypothetical protein
MNAFKPLDLNNSILNDSAISTGFPREFLLEIQEISGRNVAQKYVDYLISEFEKRKVRYEFEMIPNDEEIELNKYIGGSDLTFPYNYFDSFATNVKKILNDKQKTEGNKNYILNLFESKTKEKPELIDIDIEDDIISNYVDDIVSNDVDINNKKKSSLVLPKHYSGLIKIHLIIYDDSRESTVGRIYDLNNWIK